MSRPQPPPGKSGRFACAFDLALLAGCADCSSAEQTPVGERIVVYCRDRGNAESCQAWFARLRENAGFALPALRGSKPMTHAQAMRLRCGGLRGLASQVDSQVDRQCDGESPGDVAALVAGLPGSGKSVAWERVIRSIAAWRPPSRRARN